MLEKTLSTGCGMWALWDYEEYKNITSYEEWENLFLSDNDIIKQISNSKFVPIYIHTDGIFQFRVKINEQLSEREQKYVIATSEEYLIKTEGRLYLSGIEYIGNEVKEDEGIRLNLKSDSYSVKIHIIEWDKEPGMRLEDGSASIEALPDFTILINKENKANKKYRQKLDTFDE